MAAAQPLSAEMKDYLKQWALSFATNAFSRTGPEPNSQNVPALG